jgi:hypothetical protein
MFPKGSNDDVGVEDGGGPVVEDEASGGGGAGTSDGTEAAVDGSSATFTTTGEVCMSSEGTVGGGFV